MPIIQEERRPEVVLMEDPMKKQKLKDMVERMRKKIDDEQSMGDKPALDKKEKIAKYYYDIRQSMCRLNKLHRDPSESGARSSIRHQSHETEGRRIGPAGKRESKD